MGRCELSSLGVGGLGGKAGTMWPDSSPGLGSASDNRAHAQGVIYCAKRLTGGSGARLLLQGSHCAVSATDLPQCLHKRQKAIWFWLWDLEGVEKHSICLQLKKNG